MDYIELMRKVDVQSNVTHSCPSCESPMKCDIMQGKSNCWCFSVQAKALEMNDVCLCKSCLKKP